jgi:hypothetical protein
MGEASLDLGLPPTSGREELAAVRFLRDLLNPLHGPFARLSSLKLKRVGHEAT